MKPSPIPLFNYRKRERHALVSDPQKPSKFGDTDLGSGLQTSSISQTPASSSRNVSRFDGYSPTSWSGAGRHDDNKNNNNTIQKSHSSFNNNSNSCHLTNKPLSNTSMKPPSRRTIGKKDGMTPVQFDNEKNSTINSASQNFSTKRLNSDSNFTARGSFRGRGRGGRNIYGISSNNIPSYKDNGDYDVENTSNNISGRGWSNCPYNNSYPSPGVGLSPGSKPESSGYSVGLQSNMTMESTSSNIWNTQTTCNTRNKPNVVNLQSGNVQPQFRMTSQSKHVNTNPSHNTPIASTKSQFTRNKNNGSLSIFDDEDVMHHPSKHQKVSPTILDTSLRMFTCPIRDMQSWSDAGLYDGLVLFEIYGLIISGASGTESGIGKEFYVRDQSATICCIFYEIDREMPQLMKGQVHRLVGSMHKRQDSGGGYFKVVSMRKADKEERSSCQKATEVSLHEMDKLAHWLDKEQ